MGVRQITSDHRVGTRLAFIRLAILSVPGFLLAYAQHRTPQGESYLLLIGAAVQALLCLFYLFWPNPGQRMLCPWVITTYLIGFAWFVVADPTNDLFHEGALGVLVFVSVIAFACQWMIDSGANSIRHANNLVHEISEKTDWPENLEVTRTLPIVQQFRDAIFFEASPALSLVDHPIPQVRLVALTALEFRKNWKVGQPDMVLAIVQGNDLPLIRAAAIKAIGNLEKRELMESLARYLHDPAPEVRRAAVEGLFWDMETRWSWLRFYVRQALADAALAKDGPFFPDPISLTPEAQNDLLGWCAEKGVLAARSAQTLVSQFRKVLAESPTPKFVDNLRQQLLEPKTAAVFRIELARALQESRNLTEANLERLLMASNPAPLRMIACETVFLDFANHRMLHHNAMLTLRELGRVPNRELALATATILQRRLGLDMGLGTELPPLQSKQAADINRRVLQWASQRALPDDDGEESRLLQESGAVRY